MPRRAFGLLRAESTFRSALEEFGGDGGDVLSFF